MLGAKQVIRQVTRQWKKAANRPGNCTEHKQARRPKDVSSYNTIVQKGKQNNKYRLQCELMILTSNLVGYYKYKIHKIHKFK